MTAQEQEQPAPPGPPSRRQVVKGAAVLGGLGVLAVAGGVAGLRSLLGGDGGGSPAGPAAAAGAAPAPPSLNDLVNSILPGGPGKDGIPAIDKPQFVDAAAVHFLADEDIVFGLEYGGETRAYPQLVLVWHEIVNDTVGGRPVSVTYCPLTGTAIGFTDGLSFGTTGKLVNSNLLMYDRETDSQWPQLLGVAIRGSRRGQRLNTVALVWSTWRAWRARHPETRVLSLDTGFVRKYGEDPYGSYPRRSGYYVEGKPMFYVMSSDDRFPPKEVVVGVRVGDATPVAVHRELVRRSGSVPVTVGGTPLTVVWDRSLEAARVLDSRGTPVGDALDAMWFAWYAFFPHTEVVR